MQSQSRWHAGSTRYRAAAAGALREFRAELERRPHDPFEVDAERAVEAMRLKWGDAYSVHSCQGGFEAVRRHGAKVSLTAETADELEQLMFEDWKSW